MLRGVVHWISIRCYYFFFLGRGFLGFLHWFGRHKSEAKIAQRRRYLRFRRFVQIQMKDSPDIVLEKGWAARV